MRIFCILIAIGALCYPYLKRWHPKVNILFSIVFLCALCLVPFISPHPMIDVFVVQQEASKALLHALNPYSISYTNIYGNTPWYPGGEAKFYPYPPASLLFALTSVVTGDVRWVLIFCHFLTGVFIFLTARERKISLTESFLLAVAFCYIPRIFFNIEQAWTDTTVVFALSLFAYYFNRSKNTKALLSAGFALSLKQTTIFLVPLFFGLFKKWNLKNFILLFLLCFLTYGVFALWNWHDLFEDVIKFHFATPFRDDALTLSAVLHRLGYAPLP
ncbi:MAG: EpsG family protein, partial [Bdellovibrio sp.]|nr:EpsG family protein [Bdellovibrio sp.]